MNMDIYGEFVGAWSLEELCDKAESPQDFVDIYEIFKDIFHIVQGYRGWYKSTLPVLESKSDLMIRAILIEEGYKTLLRDYLMLAKLAGDVEDMQVDSEGNVMRLRLYGQDEGYVPIWPIQFESLVFAAYIMHEIGVAYFKSEMYEKAFGFFQNAILIEKEAGMVYDDDIDGFVRLCNLPNQSELKPRELEYIKKTLGEFSDMFERDRKINFDNLVDLADPATLGEDDPLKIRYRGPIIRENN